VNLKRPESKAPEISNLNSANYYMGQCTFRYKKKEDRIFYLKDRLRDFEEEIRSMEVEVEQRSSAKEDVILPEALPFLAEIDVLEEQAAILSNYLDKAESDEIDSEIIHTEDNSDKHSDSTYGSKIPWLLPYKYLIALFYILNKSRSLEENRPLIDNKTFGRMGSVISKHFCQSDGSPISGATINSEKNREFRTPEQKTKLIEAFWTMFNDVSAAVESETEGDE
jgi:hypothetical protein